MDNSRLYLKPLLIALLLGAPGTTFGQAGSSGMAFLKLSPSASGAAMGDAAAGWVSGADAVFYNPAGVFPADGKAQLMIAHREWIQETRMEHLAASLPVGEATAVGFSISALAISDIEIRTRPGPAEGTFTARNISVAATYAQEFWKNLRFGATAKYLYEKILVDEAAGLAFDLGAQWDLGTPDISLGAALANLGSMGTLREERTSLPAYLRLGSASSFDFSDLHSAARIAADLQYIFPVSRAYLNIGGEFTYDETLSLRSGYQLGSGARGYTGGIGIRYGVLQIDYAYAPLTYDLGDAHTIGLLLRL